MTVAWGPFGVSLVTTKKKRFSDDHKVVDTKEVGEFAAFDEAVRQARTALAKEKANEDRHALIVGPERDGVRTPEATVEHPDFGGAVTDLTRATKPRSAKRVTDTEGTESWHDAGDDLGAADD